MRNVRKLLLMLILTMLASLLTGCWDLVELNKTTLITGVAIEPGHQGQVRVTVETLNASEAAHKQMKGTSPSVVQSIEGESLGEALIKINQSLDRTLLASHIGIIVFDEALARTGLSKYLDLLQRSRYLREDVMIFIARDVRASETLKVMYPRGEYSSLKISEQAKSYAKAWGGITDSRLFDLTQALLVQGREPIIGAIKVRGNPKSSSDMESIKTVSPRALVVLTGMAVFRGDRVVGYLTPEQSRMVVIARNKLRGTTLTVPLEEKGVHALIRLTRIQAKMQAAIVNGKPDLRLVIHGQGIIGSIEEKSDLGNVAGYQHLEALTSKFVQQQMSQTIQSIQHQFGVDVFGFGEHLYRRSYKQFKQIAGSWNERFAETPIKVEAAITLLRAELKKDKINIDESGP